MTEVTKEILAAFLGEVPEAWDAASDDQSSFGIEWHFHDGSVFWIDIDPALGLPRFLWRKGRDGKPVSGEMNAQGS